MRAQSKVILFSRATIGKAVHNHPVAVFGKDAEAKAYAVMINTAIKSGNVEMAKSLDAKTHLNEDGTLVPNVKFALVTVPYAPTFGGGADELFAEDNSAAS